MFNEKERKDLELLAEIGKKQENKLDSIIVSNYFAGFPTSRQTEQTYNEIIEYLRKVKIEVLEEQETVEEEKDSLIPVIRPFDPNKIDIEMRHMELSNIIKRMEYNEINMETAFQRKGGLWTDIQKSQLIESLFLCIPLPAFYFDGGVKDDWLIIDGLQRLTAIKEFVIEKKLKLTGLEFFSDLDGAKFSDLPRTFVRRIEETNIIAYVVKGGTPANVKYNIFKRINTGGLILTPQEIRHALNQGHATEICRNFSKMQEFKLATTYSISENRMMDQEFVLRFVAVCYYGIDKYDGVPDNYLNAAMEYLNSRECVEEEEMKKQFQRVMNASRNIMGKYAFRKMGEDGIRRPINKAIYEAWCRSLFYLNDDEIIFLQEKKEEVRSHFLELCNEPLFLQIIKGSDKKAFMMRFLRIDRFLKGVLYDSQYESGKL